MQSDCYILRKRAQARHLFLFKWDVDSWEWHRIVWFIMCIATISGQGLQGRIELAVHFMLGWVRIYDCEVCVCWKMHSEEPNCRVCVDGWWRWKWIVRGGTLGNALQLKHWMRSFGFVCFYMLVWAICSDSSRSFRPAGSVPLSAILAIAAGLQGAWMQSWVKNDWGINISLGKEANFPLSKHLRLY